jgi:hypothetical protein
MKTLYCTCLNSAWFSRRARTLGYRVRRRGARFVVRCRDERKMQLEVGLCCTVHARDLATLDEAARRWL